MDVPLLYNTTYLLTLSYNNYSNELITKINYYFSILMIALYVIMSFFLIFVKDLHFLDPPNQTILGAVLFCYALFRLYKLIKQKKDENYSENENQ